MIKLFQNISNYCKYGKVVHQSPNGTTIRKKVTKSLFGNFDPDIETTKTVINNNKVTKIFNRRVYKTDNARFQVFNAECYDQFGSKIAKKTGDKEYEITKDSKIIIDYTKLDCDYIIKKSPDGNTKYEIIYPQVTEIKNGKVTTTQKNQTYTK